MKTFEEDVLVLKEVNTYFKNSASAYRIINTNYDRPAEELHKVRMIIDLLDKARFFSGEILERF